MKLRIMRSNTVSRYFNQYGFKPHCKSCEQEIKVDDDYVSIPGKSGSRTYRCRACEEKRVT